MELTVRTRCMPCSFPTDGRQGDKEFHVNNKLDEFKIRKTAPCPGGVCGPLNYHARSRQGQRWGKASECPGGACRPRGYQAGAKPFSAQVGFASITFGVDAGMIKAPERKTIKNTLHQNGTGQVNPCTPDLMPMPPCRKTSEKCT